MGTQPEDKKPEKYMSAGLLAHVDAGKTTLSEAILYTCGAIRRPGRVDNQDAFLDHYELERKRGITIFSKQARVSCGKTEMILLDTPGHVDFSAEMERTLQVLDVAILVISGADGVQGHTRTLWRLLARYGVPVFLFVNKMDQPGTDRQRLIRELTEELDSGCVDFGGLGTETFREELALCDEALLNEFLATGEIKEEGIRAAIAGRRIFPCFFGSALKLTGVEALIKGLEVYGPTPAYPTDVHPTDIHPVEFGARVFKITRDEKGNRLTHLKVTSGVLKAKDLLTGRDHTGAGEVWEEKVNQIRLYSGERFETVSEAVAGEICTVTGLTRTFPGEGLGREQEQLLPFLEPVLVYALLLPEGCEAAVLLPKLKLLQEEDPLLKFVYEEELQEIQVRVMGEVQTEILKSVIEERFGVTVSFGAGRIVYRETIAHRVEGVGHFEPLRHYAEVHLLLEPGEPGSGLVFDTACREEVLAGNWQRLILTHLAEKEHRGVLTGSVITDMKITLVSGRAHPKHTEGGDFRQATYRAVRQGLMEAESVLLEPYYEFRLEAPTESTGRAMTDLEKRFSTFSLDQTKEGRTLIVGTGPVSCLQDYQKEVTAYTKGTGRLFLTLKGYGVCHNPEEVIAETGYQPEADLKNPADSVFCAHGAGYLVPADQVKQYMHLESWLKEENISRMEGTDMDAIWAAELQRRRETALRRNRENGEMAGERFLGTEEIDAILNRTAYANSRIGGAKSREGWQRRRESEQTGSGGNSGYGNGAVRFGRGNPEGRSAAAGENGKTAAKDTGGRENHAAPLYKGREKKEEYLLVDGYNVIFAWEELRELAQKNLDGARGRLLDILCEYQAVRSCRLIVVFDAYRLQGHPEETLDYHNIHVVYTKEAETADRYIERFAHQNSHRYEVTVATSDGLEQIIIRGQGCRLLSALDLQEEIRRAGENLKENFRAAGLKEHASAKRYLFDEVPQEVLAQFKAYHLPQNR